MKSEPGRFELKHLIVILALSIGGRMPAVHAQPGSHESMERIAIHGSVHNPAGQSVADAVVRLEKDAEPLAVETKTNAAGGFALLAPEGNYALVAEKSGVRSRKVFITVSSSMDRKEIDVVLTGAAAVESHPTQGGSVQSQVMEFSDKPNFTIAAVTDWTAAGGHGSDASLRTSEALTREAVTLKGSESENSRTHPAASASESKLRAALAAAPGSFDANRKLGECYFQSGKYREAIPLLEVAFRLEPGDRDNERELMLALKESSDFPQAREHVQRLLEQGESAELHRVAGEVAEKLGDPLAAVHEFERAVRMDPSETNYFAWGSELLLHRAVWQAQQIFEEGAKAYPRSARILTALGAALFAGARYDEAALRLCDASDLNPANVEPYEFMGRIVGAAPIALPCVKQKLERFVQQQPGNSFANYFYAMAIWKEHVPPIDSQVFRQVEGLLAKAVALDPKCADAYFQLGNLYASQDSFEKASEFYQRAIEADPQLADAHYRLGVAFDRTGQREKAKREFELHDTLKKQQAAAVEQQRKEVKQFLVVAPAQADSSTAH
jgi:tetratricopeptide (TPR) repeat protein